jgi:tetratricopeptide (TPR) repeat protein
LLQEAFAAYERGLVFDNDNEHILYNLGVMYSDVGNYEGADLCFKRLPKEFRIDGVVPVFNAGQAKP